MTVQCLKKTILSGWPNSQEKIAACLKEYWLFREELTVQNGIIFKGHQIVIPKAMRPELLKRIHSSHLGVAACLRKAKDALFWPHMAAEVRNLVGKCEACAELKENLMTHMIPDRPWNNIALDLSTLAGKDYLISGDYYSDFLGARPLTLYHDSSASQAETTLCQMGYTRGNHHTICQ